MYLDRFIELKEEKVIRPWYITFTALLGKLAFIAVWYSDHLVMQDDWYDPQPDFFVLDTKMLKMIDQKNQDIGLTNFVFLSDFHEIPSAS